jgi:hypothetical protein
MTDIIETVGIFIFPQSSRLKIRKENIKDSLIPQGKEPLEKIRRGTRNANLIV